MPEPDITKPIVDPNKQENPPSQTMNRDMARAWNSEATSKNSPSRNEERELAAGGSKPNLPEMAIGDAQNEDACKAWQTWDGTQCVCATNNR